MDALLTTVALLIVMVLALVLLSRAWVRSSRVGGYRASHRADGIEDGAQASTTAGPVVSAGAERA